MNLNNKNISDKKDSKVSVVIPAFNEEENIGNVLEVLKEIEYINEIIVVDDGSHDKTSEIAKKSGAILVQHINNQGKGAALKTGFKHSKGDIIAFIDGDITNLNSSMIDAIINPILENKTSITKTKFLREGGRVTELTAKPLLKFFFPEINFDQPLSGQFAAKRSALEKIKFERDYGVDIGIVLDADAKGIKIEEVDIGELKHTMSPLNSLNEMANEVVRTIIARATEYGRVTMMDTMGNYIRNATLGLSLVILGLFMIFFVTWTPLLLGEIVSIGGIILALYYLILLIIQTYSMYNKKQKTNFLKTFFKMHLTLILSAFVLVLMLTTFFAAANISGGKISIEPSSRNLVIFPGSSQQTIYLKGPYTIDTALENESNLIRIPQDALDTLELSYGDNLIINNEKYSLNQTREDEKNMLRIPRDLREYLTLRIDDSISDGRILSIFKGSSVNHFINSSNLTENETGIFNYELNSHSTNGVLIDVYLDNKYLNSITGDFLNNNSYSISFNGDIIGTIIYNNDLIGNSYYGYYGEHIVELKFVNSSHTVKSFKTSDKEPFLSFSTMF